MRVLLLAYEYPPIVAAQSLRWFYLANELAAMGVEVHVLCPSLPALPVYPVPNHPLIIEHRVWAGPFIGLSQWLAMRAGHGEVGSGGAEPEAGQSVIFRVYRVIRFVLDRILYPDVRSEWYPFARARLAKLLRHSCFDVVISSHEPGVDLLLGLWAKKRHNVRWIVDLADPLCAPYSPKWRRWLDRWVEGKVIRLADRVVLTTDRLRDLLMERHCLEDGTKFVCIPQGAPTIEVASTAVDLMHGKLNIVFTGNFYEEFRNPQQFALALKSLASQEIALTVVGDNERFRPMFEGVKNVHFLGKMGHFDCLALQRRADLLLNIGNAQAFQIPGKIYEYMGAGRTILHIRAASGDPSEDLLLATGMGRIVDNEALAIARLLNDLLAEWRNGRLGVDGCSCARFMEEHSWSSRASLLAALISETKSSEDISSKCVVLHDFMLVNGGAEKLVDTLAVGMGCPLAVGFVGAGRGRLLSEQSGKLEQLGSPFQGRLARYLVTSWRFTHLALPLLDRAAVIYSGVIAPMAVHRQQRGRRIYYCHSPPRFLYDLKDYYAAKAGFFGRIALYVLERWLKPRYERAVRAMDLVIANSENVRRRLQHYLGVETVVVYPPIDTDRYRWRGQDDFFLSVARLEDFKRVDSIVYAFRRMPHQHLVVASGGSQEATLRKLADGCSNITFTSWLTEEGLSDLIGRCRAVIYIPIDEDFGMSPVEAMAAGKPVIGVAEGGMLETVVDGETGVLLASPPCVEGLMAAVERMDASLALSMRAACEERARQFSEKNFLSRMRQLTGIES